MRAHGAHKARGARGRSARGARSSESAGTRSCWRGVRCMIVQERTRGCGTPRRTRRRDTPSPSCPASTESSPQPWPAARNAAEGGVWASWAKNDGECCRFCGQGEEWKSGGRRWGSGLQRRRGWSGRLQRMGGGRRVLRAGRVLSTIGPGSVLAVALALAPAPVRWMTARRWWLVCSRRGRFVRRALCSSRSWGMTAIRCLGCAGGRVLDGAVRALNDRRRGVVCGAAG
ncbi:hypothetical protein DFH09DRAFT_298825 [Mycena vulgaris]|nr:hypothetical protein DFH09DRAFT_298825 [Mycena vulgaris]